MPEDVFGAWDEAWKALVDEVLQHQIVTQTVAHYRLSLEILDAVFQLEICAAHLPRINFNQLLKWTELLDRGRLGHRPFEADFCAGGRCLGRALG